MSKIYKTFVLVYSGYYNKIRDWVAYKQQQCISGSGEVEMSETKLLLNSASDEILLSDLNIGSSD